MDILQERGVRVTPQRAHIWRVLAGSDKHLTAEDIWERVGEMLPGLEVSTVYRTLEALEEAGLVVASRLPEGPRVFEARTAVHPHLACSGCGGIFHPEPEVGRRLIEVLGAGSTGFEVHRLHVVAEGLCPKCAARDKGR
ncbi:MAG: Fur family transcriptional regulator [Rubrobacteraceae bacterium]